ncbi:MAG: nucleotidyltransferase domain-containing protein [Anaerolineae bacterium]|nr:nucleotidyltransferase domain-containing protein [Anaerolineae bacterium]
MVSEICLHMEKASDLCDAYGVIRLDVFGSASRDDFDPEQSDIDFLVEFAKVHPLGAFDRYFGLKEALEELFQRSVDLIDAKAIRNPYFRQVVENDKVLVYASGN